MVGEGLCPLQSGLAYDPAFAAAELHKGYRVMLFAVWFFAIAFMVNGLARPVLAVITRGSFPGLISSPVVGLMGVLPWRRFYEPTKAVA